MRFFSRDAYRVISPEHSSTEVEDHTLYNRLSKATSSRPTVQQVFSTPTPAPPPKDDTLSAKIVPSTSTPMMGPMTIPPSSLGNIFEFSEDVLNEVPTIPAIDAPSTLLDSAIEVTETDTETDNEKEAPTVRPDDENRPAPASLAAPFGQVLAESSPRPLSGPHDRSQSFSFGQTMFQSVKTALEDVSRGVPPRPPSVNRNRAMSDTVFTSMIHSPMSAFKDRTRPEQDINDVSQAVVAYAPQMSPPPKKVEHDPFGANAMTYYEPGKMLPPSPPQSNHTRTASREEDLIWDLRTQLALQTELCGQYEVDLAARDELVENLTKRLGDVEHECERRKAATRSWRKRVTDLERCVKGLEESVERSREESFERSVMDEASGEALRVLQNRIKDREREKADVERREGDARIGLEAREKELIRASEEMRVRDERERELQDGIKAAREQMEQMGQDVQVDGDAEERKRHTMVESTWEHERAELQAKNDTLRDDQVKLQSELTTLREETVKKDKDLEELRTELEAQWHHTEQAGEEMERLKQERAALNSELNEMRAHLEGLEGEREENEVKYSELDNEVQEVWTAKEEAEKARDEASGRTISFSGLMLIVLPSSSKTSSRKSASTPTPSRVLSRSVKIALPRLSMNESTRTTACPATKRPCASAKRRSLSCTSASRSATMRRRTSMRRSQGRSASTRGSSTSRAESCLRSSRARLSRAMGWSER